MDLDALNRTLDGGSAQAALNEALDLLPDQSGSGRLRLLLFIARCYGVMGIPVEALRASLQARAKAIELGDSKAEAEALLDAGAAHQRVDEHAAAIGYFEQAEHLLESIDDPHLHHGLLRRMGVVFIDPRSPRPGIGLHRTLHSGSPGLGIGARTGCRHATP
jgi:tetratricopeptide (TPR) repeat protein